jgi:hypothetical protein
LPQLENIEAIEKNLWSAADWMRRREIEQFAAQKLSSSLKSGNLLEKQWLPEERNVANGQGLYYTPQGTCGA